jgi:Icc-related predicted phosphoesterase
VRITITSDFHGYLPAAIKPCDLLLIAGDICPHGPYSQRASAEFQQEWLNRSFREFLEYVPAKEVVGIWGNHDFAGQAGRVPKGLRWQLLQDSLTTVNGVSIYGSPWSLRFYDWAFMKSEQGLDSMWSEIPTGVDILMVHGPANRVRDRVRRGDYVGSETLRQQVEHRIKPKMLVTGHIHEANGITYPPYELPQTIAVNGSYCDELTYPGQPAWSFDWNTVLGIVDQAIETTIS